MEIKERIKKVSENPETTEEGLINLEQLEKEESELKKESNDIINKINEFGLSTDLVKYRALIVEHITPKNR